MASMFACGAPRVDTKQLETLQGLVTKHIQDPALRDMASGDNDFRITSTERGVTTWEHEHLVAALDILNSYQRDRRQRSAPRLMGQHYISRSKQYTHDPRTRLAELLKRWLRTHAACTNLNEAEVRSVCGLCRDILDHQELFPARNPRSFLRSVAEVHDHLQCQLRQVLEKDRTCAELAAKVISLSKNLLSDAIAYLMLAPTDLRQTDSLPSLQVVALWQSLPGSGHPLPNRADPALQKQMRDAWLTRCGGLVAALLVMPQCIRLFGSAGAEDEAAAAAAAGALLAVADDATPTGADRSPCTATGWMSEHLPALLANAEEDFDNAKYKGSGLAGAFRQPSRFGARRNYLNAVEASSDLLFLLGDVLIQFHRLSDGLGDYGMIRVASWLHPFLEVLAEKVQRLKANLEQFNQAADETYVMARAKGSAVPKPSPSSRMCSRAHSAIERAVTGRESHAQSLLQAIDELRTRSSPERLPQVTEGLGDACLQLQAVLSSSEFRACVGDSFPELPPLAPGVAATRAAHLSDSAGGSTPGGNRCNLVLRDGSVLEVVDDDASVTSLRTSRSASSLGTGSTRASSTMTWQPSAAWLTQVRPTRMQRASSVPSSQRADAPALGPPLRQRKTHDGASRASSPASCVGMFNASSRAASPANSGGTRRQEESQKPAQSFSLHRGYITRGGDLLRQTITVEEAKRKAARLPGCKGFCFSGVDTGAAMDIFFKDKWDFNEGGGWSSYRIVVPGLTAQVQRLSTALGGRGWKYHDRRSLELSAGELRIFEKGSTSKVKLAVDVATEVEECCLMAGGVMSIALRKQPAGSDGSEGVREHKSYLFEFPTTRSAAAFHREIDQLLELNEAPAA